MIARLTVGVPYALAVPNGAQFKAYSFEDAGYVVIARPPVASDNPIQGDKPVDVTLDGSAAFVASALQIDFRKPEFTRAKDNPTFDPPLDVMQRATTSLVSRLRFVSRASQIQLVELNGRSSWRLQYLNDDETELQADPQLVRARGGLLKSVSLAAVTPAVWDEMHSLDTEWRSPVWDDILLDAISALPRVGTAIVLAATALEVFIADVLDRVAAEGDVPLDTWRWMNDRRNWLKDPSTEEQFDFLLKHFVGHSLKDDAALWQAFTELRRARNEFVHQGIARIGTLNVDSEKGRQLVSSSGDIIRTVRAWLPTEKQWPQPEVKIQIAFKIPLK